MSSWCDLLREGLISYRPQRLSIHQGDHGSTVRHSRGQSASEAYQGELRDRRWRFHLTRGTRGMQMRPNREFTHQILQNLTFSNKNNKLGSVYTKMGRATQSRRECKRCREAATRTRRLGIFHSSQNIPIYYPRYSKYQTAEEAT